MTARKPASEIPPKITDVEHDLLWHMEHGYQLETDLRSGEPVLRSLKDGAVIRPSSANRNTVKALQGRGLIGPGKGRDPLIVSCLSAKAKNGMAAAPSFQPLSLTHPGRAPRLSG